MEANQMARWADAIMMARDSGWLLDRISSTVEFDLDDAYRIQRLVLQARESRGERRVGWKLGFTSDAIRQQMQVNAPNFGPLTDQMIIATGTPLSSHLVHPRVEPEVAVRLNGAIGPDADRSTVAMAVQYVYAALEVVDSVWRNYEFRLEDNTADCSSAAQVVMGPSLDADADFDELPVVLYHNGTAVAESTGAAAMGNPIDAVAWLSSELPRHGFSLCAGDVVLTGALTAALPIAQGESVEAVFGDRACVSTYRV